MIGPKAYPENVEYEEIRKYFTNMPLIHLATIDGKYPRVRMMALIEHNDTLWLATKSHWDKVEQIRNNPNIEFTLPVRGEKETGCIRVTGKAKIVEDQNLKEEPAKAIPWFNGYWTSPKHSSFALISLSLSSIKYDNPFDRKKYSKIF